MRKQLAIALLIIGAGTAHARLEENITQCDQRYNIGGKSANADPLDGVSPLIRGPNTSHVVYRHDGWKIRIGYLNTIAVVVEYRRLDHGKLDDAQFQLLLNVTSGGFTRPLDPKRRRYAITQPLHRTLRIPLLQAPPRTTPPPKRTLQTTAGDEAVDIFPDIGNFSRRFSATADKSRHWKMPTVRT
jgi:hypothetical protein